LRIHTTVLTDKMVVNYKLLCVDPFIFVYYSVDDFVAELTLVGRE